MVSVKVVRQKQPDTYDDNCGKLHTTHPRKRECTHAWSGRGTCRFCHSIIRSHTYAGMNAWKDRSQSARTYFSFTHARMHAVARIMYARISSLMHTTVHTHAGTYKCVEIFQNLRACFYELTHVCTHIGTLEHVEIALTFFPLMHTYAGIHECVEIFQNMRARITLLAYAHSLAPANVWSISEHACTLFSTHAHTRKTQAPENATAGHARTQFPTDERTRACTLHSTLA